jgi:hypothetical protein
MTIPEKPKPGSADALRAEETSVKPPQAQEKPVKPPQSQFVKPNDLSVKPPQGN